MSKELESSTIGERIRNRRRQIELSQIQVAQRAGVSMQAVSLWEKDKATPSSTNLQALADALSCDVNWLLRGDSYDEEAATNKMLENENAKIQMRRRRREPTEPRYENSEDPRFLMDMFRNLNPERKRKAVNYMLDLYREEAVEKLKSYENIMKKSQ